MDTGHSGVAYLKFPALDLGVVVFTNLEHPQGSDPAGLALGVAGLLEPALSLRSITTPSTGAPDLSVYAPALRETLWRSRDTFRGRLPRLGALESWEFLRESVVDGGPALLFRATHAHGEVYARYSLDPQGRVSRLVWWHL